MTDPDAPLDPGDVDGPLVVGIGASAGGLAALKRFFSNVPADSGLAYVVVVHLSPEHESHLADLLQPHVSMPVQQVADTTPLEPDNVYVIPPGRNLTSIDTHIRLDPLEARRRERAPIDHFFRTLARTHDGHAVAVVLTGTGSDGTLGLKEIKERGGLAVVQDPVEAEYDGMPQSALATGIVDLVLGLDAMPDAILRFAHTEPQLVLPADGDAAEDDAHRLQKIFAQLRARTGRDFSRYKRSTILRRVRRRMQLAAIEDLGDYLERLRSDQDEVRALADDLLITVTNFFRDPAVFEALEREVVPKLFAGKGADDVVRVWSVGCATGEEAYSLAMVLAEEAERHPEPPRVQVFASDLHEHSLQTAREGFYPGDIETDVSLERIRRFFKKEDSGYRVRKEIRELVIFAPHNLLGDPPFSKLDLISCRNLLIYLQREVQREVVEVFHYALLPGGYLLLGTSETIEQSELFRTIEKRACLYQRRNVPAPEPRLPVFPSAHRRMLAAPAGDDRTGEPIAYGSLHQRMVESYAPPSILISPDDKIVHLPEHAGRYLVHPGGELTSSPYKLVREELRIELRTAIHAARKGHPVRSEPIRVRFNGHAADVVVDARPALAPAEDGFVLVIFDERPEASPHPPREPSELDRVETNELRAELEMARQRLQAIIEEYETSQEEMKASNEELQSANEELRSTMEELETSKEELQSMNEELQTVNQENRHKVEELDQLSSDLSNLLGATDIATLFLDRQLRIMRFTHSVADLFNVRATDRGRPLADLTHRLGYEALIADARQVLERLVPVEREVGDEEGRWYLTRVLPYRSTEDRIDGVVITFVDITERKRSEQALAESEARLRALVTASTDVVYRMSPDWSEMRELDGRGFLADTASPRTGWLEDYIPDEDRDAVQGAIRAAVEQSRPFELEHRVVQLDGTIGWTLSRAVPLLGEDGEVTEWFGAASDISARKQFEAELRDAKEYAESIIETLHEPLLVLRPDLRVQTVNAAFYTHFDVDPAETDGRLVYELGNGQWDIPALRTLLEDVLPEDNVFDDYEVEHEFESIGRRVMLLNARRLDHVQLILLGIRDITEQKRATQALEELAETLEERVEARARELREHEERFRRLVEASALMVWTTDPEGQVVEDSPSWCAFTGQSREERLGEGWAGAVHPDDRAHALETWFASVRDETPVNTELRIRHADSGAYRWTNLRAVPLRDDAGRVRGWIGMTFDIDARKQAEAGLRRMATRLTMAEQQERRRLAQVLHDDLQQLLYGVEMKLGMLQQDLGDAASAGVAEAREWLGRAITLTRQLTVELSPPLLEQEGLADALEWLQRQMKELHGLDVALEREGDVRVRDEDRRVLLFQIVRELLFNVKKHAGTTQATVRLSATDDELVIAVADPGRGFDATRAREASATGFGLASIEERLRQVGGRLDVRSAPGEGTQVVIRVPVTGG